MNLNKKGYMLVEIVIAFGIAMAIAYYLMNLTYKFKNTNEDIYQSTIYLKDKVSVTKNIMNDLEKSTIVEYNKCNDTNQNCIMLKTQDGTEKKIEAKKDETTGVIKIIYGDIDSNGVYKNNASYYEKELEKSLYAGEIKASSLNNNYFSISIPIFSLYDNNDYNIKIFAQKNLSKQEIYTYKGNYEVFTAVKTGWYKIEAWGAQGGASNSINAGGKGGYTSGYIQLNAGEKLYIYVGNFGFKPENLNKPFNGGGKPDITGTWNDSHDGKFSGGGATDIRYFSSTPSSSDLAWDSAVGLNSRIMVAGGGGGGNNGDGSTGGSGGNLVGGTTNFKDPNGRTVGYPTQISGYSFGIGQGSGVFNTDGGADTGAGGGGWYGGYRGLSTNSGGSGGSSFISGHAGVNARNNNRTHTNDTRHYSGKYFINTEMKSGLNEGNGEVIIKYVADKPIRKNTKLDNVRYIRDCINGNTVNRLNHWVEIQAIVGGYNIAKNRTVTGVTNDSAAPLSLIVDGDVTSSKYARDANGAGGNQCITIDLGATYNLDEIAVWHYWADDRMYNNNVTSVSSNNSNWTKVIEKAEKETADGKRVNAYQ